ncbi:hypothetical protein HK102_010620 [Quaeritorhiza haematococci]|nr:hypothetical protein HK102_010620 [Quaeritorhiza haematococci]
MKALKKRLKHENPVVLSHALSVLDMFMKNCGAKFQLEVTSRDGQIFIQKTLARPDLAPELRVRLLEMIQGWAFTITDPSIQPHVQSLYGGLLALGYQFPGGRPSGPQPTQPSISSLAPEERKKRIANDIQLANNNVQMFLEALNFVDPDEDVTKNELIQEFRMKCKEIQQRVIKLLEEIEDDDQLEPLIKLNGDINNIMKQYDDIVEQKGIDMVKKVSEVEFTARGQQVRLRLYNYNYNIRGFWLRRVHFVTRAREFKLM